MGLISNGYGAKKEADVWILEVQRSWQGYTVENARVARANEVETEI